MGTRAVWKDLASKTFYLYRNPEDETPLVLSQGTCITWEGREDYVKIIEVFGRASDDGPIGFTYLPYRKEGRWATPAWSLRGDARFIICYPSGTPHYGLHIQLQTIRVDDAPLYMDPPGILTLIGNPLVPETIIEIRHKIMKMCSTTGLTYQLKNNIDLCYNDDVKFKICITHMIDSTNYRIDFYYVSGTIELIHTYANHLDLYYPK